MRVVKVISLVALTLFAAVSPASATLLGLDYDYPVVVSDSPGNYAYDADTQLLHAWGYSVSIAISDSTSVDILPRGFYDVQFYVDSLGNFQGGVPGQDLVITGAVPGYPSPLLTGEVRNFGWDYDSGTDTLWFDFTFTATDGSLLPFYASNNARGYDLSRSPGTTFTDWTVDHGGARMKANTAPIPAVPEPAGLLVLGAGLLGMGLIIRRKRKS